MKATEPKLLPQLTPRPSHHKLADHTKTQEKRHGSCGGKVAILKGPMGRENALESQLSRRVPAGISF